MGDRHERLTRFSGHAAPDGPQKWHQMANGLLGAGYRAALRREQDSAHAYDAACSSVPVPNLAVESAAGPALRMLGALASSAAEAARTKSSGDVEEFVARWHLVARSLGWTVLRRQPSGPSHYSGLCQLLRWRWQPAGDVGSMDKSGLGCDYVFMSYLRRAAPSTLELWLHGSRPSDRLVAALVPPGFRQDSPFSYRWLGSAAEDVPASESLREHFGRLASGEQSSAGELEERSVYEAWRLQLMGMKDRQQPSAASFAAPVAAAALEARSAMLDAAAAVIRTMGPRSEDWARALSGWSEKAEAAAAAFPSGLLSCIARVPTQADLEEVAGWFGDVMPSDGSVGPVRLANRAAASFRGCVVATQEEPRRPERRGSPVTQLLLRMLTAMRSMQSLCPSSPDAVKSPEMVQILAMRAKAYAVDVSSAAVRLRWHLSRSRRGPALWL